MRSIFKIGILLLLVVACKSETSDTTEIDAKNLTRPCEKEGTVLQILGSGGPLGFDGRASSGYLVYKDGRPLAMIDAGGGTFLRLHESKARLNDIRFIGISHLHPDHASDLPAILWSDAISNRDRPVPLTVAGPAAAGTDGISAYLSALNDMVVPLDAFTRIKISEVEARQDSTRLVYKDEEMNVWALGVQHAHKPTLAYKIQLGDKSICFSADQLLDNPVFTEFVRGTDLLVLHMAISESAVKPFTNLHAKPVAVGLTAMDANPGQLVLSHLIMTDSSKTNATQFSLSDLESCIEQVGENYKGNIVVAEDLLCIPF